MIGAGRMESDAENAQGDAVAKIIFWPYCFAAMELLISVQSYTNTLWPITLAYFFLHTHWPGQQAKGEDTHTLYIYIYQLHVRRDMGPTCVSTGLIISDGVAISLLFFWDCTRSAQGQSVQGGGVSVYYGYSHL